MKGSIGLRKVTATVNGVQSLSTGPTWTTIIAKTVYACSGIEIFNASGSVLQLATGAAGHEVVIPYSILPGGTSSWITMEIPAGVRISATAVDANTTSSQLILNFFQ
jgi:hypothetical protein